MSWMQGNDDFCCRQAVSEPSREVKLDFVQNSLDVQAGQPNHTGEILRRRTLMLTISQSQLATLDQKADGSLCEQIMQELRAEPRISLPPNDAELGKEVAERIRDARVWGLQSDASVTQYVISCLTYLGSKEDLPSRLEVYLRLHHEPLTVGMNLPEFCRGIVVFAQAHEVLADEGAAWLATLVLAGYNRGASDLSWIAPLLDQSLQNEEARMHLVHQRAEARGWLTKGRD